MDVEPKTTLQDFSTFHRKIGDALGVIYAHVQNMLYQQMKKLYNNCRFLQIRLWVNGMPAK
jgi:hypothetical protein